MLKQLYFSNENFHSVLNEDITENNIINFITDISEKALPINNTIKLQNYILTNNFIARKIFFELLFNLQKKIVDLNYNKWFWFDNKFLDEIWQYQKSRVGDKFLIYFRFGNKNKLRRKKDKHYIFVIDFKNKTIKEFFVHKNEILTKINEAKRTNIWLDLLYSLYNNIESNKIDDLISIIRNMIIIKEDMTFIDYYQSLTLTSKKDLQKKYFSSLNFIIDEDWLVYINWINAKYLTKEENNVLLLKLIFEYSIWVDKEIILIENKFDSINAEAFFTFLKNKDYKEKLNIISFHSASMLPLDKYVINDKDKEVFLYSKEYTEENDEIWRNRFINIKEYDVKNPRDLKTFYLVGWLETDYYNQI